MKLRLAAVSKLTMEQAMTVTDLKYIRALRGRLVSFGQK